MFSVSIPKKMKKKKLLLESGENATSLHKISFELSFVSENNESVRWKVRLLDTRKHSNKVA